jgi:hypothetical protein
VRGCNQESEMFAAFSRAALSGTPTTWWPRLSLLTQAVMDACYASLKQAGAKVAVAAVA